MSSGKYESHIFWAQPLHHGVWATRKSLFASAIALNTQRIIAIENLKKKIAGLGKSPLECSICDLFVILDERANNKTKLMPIEASNYKRHAITSACLFCAWTLSHRFYRWRMSKEYRKRIVSISIHIGRRCINWIVREKKNKIRCEQICIATKTM